MKLSLVRFSKVTGKLFASLAFEMLGFVLMVFFLLKTHGIHHHGKFSHDLGEYGTGSLFSIHLC